MSFFDVPMVKKDVWMLHDGSLSGLNNVMWLPCFTLPMLNTHLSLVEVGTFFLADIYVGKTFLHFLHATQVDLKVS